MAALHTSATPHQTLAACHLVRAAYDVLQATYCVLRTACERTNYTYRCSSLTLPLTPYPNPIQAQLIASRAVACLSASASYRHTLAAEGAVPALLQAVALTLTLTLP